MLRPLSNLSLLFLILLSKTIFQVFILMDGFISVSGDDFLRSLIAYDWSKEPFLSSTSFGGASVLWMPLHFWIVGSLLKIYMDLWLVPALVSLFFSLLTLVMLYLIAQHLFNSRVGLITVILAGFLPWGVWLSISGIAATIYQFTIVTGIYCILKWEDSRRSNNKYLLFSSLAFLSSTMLRPEGWLFTAIFSSYLLSRFFTPLEKHVINDRYGSNRKKSIVRVRFKASSFLTGFTHWEQIQNKGFMVVTVIIPWIFIGYWLYFNYTAYGDPLYFVKLSKLSYQMEATSLDSLAIRVLKYPFLMFIVSPVISILSIFSLLRFFKLWAKVRTNRTYLFFILAGLSMLVIASIIGSGTRSTPQRYVVLNILLFIPLVSAMFDHYLQRRGWKKIVLISIIGVFALNLSSSYRYSKGYGDEAKVGRFLREAWRQKKLLDDDMICSDRTFRAYVGIPYNTYIERMYSLTNRWAMQVLSNHPDNFVFNIVEDNRLALNANQNKLSDYFRKSKIRLIIVKSEESVKKMPGTFQFAGSVGGYMLFSEQPALFTQWSLKTMPEVEYKLMKNFGNTIVLLGYDLDKNLFPRYITLYWKLLKKDSTDYRIFLKYISSEGRNVKLANIITPHYGAYKTSQWKLNEVIEERIYFPHSKDLVAGDYFLRISLVDLYLQSLPIVNRKADETELDIGPIYIIPSKRAVIKDFIGGRSKDLRLLFKVLTSL